MYYKRLLQESNEDFGVVDNNVIDAFTDMRKYPGGEELESVLAMLQYVKRKYKFVHPQD